MPVNAVTGHKYRGVNVVSLWAASSEYGWPGEWASYRQWQSAGAQVRKGERGSVVVFYKTIEKDKRDASGAVVTDDDGEAQTDRIFLARASTVFKPLRLTATDRSPSRKGPCSPV